MIPQLNLGDQHKTCADCPLFKPFDDGTGRGLCYGVANTSLVVRQHHALTQDCQHLIDEQSPKSRQEKADNITTVSENNKNQFDATKHYNQRLIASEDIEVLEQHRNHFVVSHGMPEAHALIVRAALGSSQRNFKP